jgi:hypothetical protein
MQPLTPLSYGPPRRRDKKKKKKKKKKRIDAAVDAIAL